MTYAHPEDKLLEMLTYKRPHDTNTESAFVQKYLIEPYQMSGMLELMGPMRNVVIITDINSSTLFSSHTDTVHSKEGMQEVMFDKNIAYAYKNDNECLGADDTTGVWLMLAMIEAKVPGTYVFHRGEERGGIGSRWMADNKVDFLKQFKRAIAFDRKGEESVITMQRGMKCCSNEFADALSKQLGKDWKADDTGTFTDTANYTHLIPECTNISVGYYDQHTKDEQQNVEFALDLAIKLTNIQWETLPTIREAKREAWQPRSFGYQPYTRQSSFEDDDFGFNSAGYRLHSMHDDPITDMRRRADAAFNTPPKGTQTPPPAKDIIPEGDIGDEMHLMTNGELSALTLRELHKLCKNNPIATSLRMRELLNSYEEMQDALNELSEMFADLEMELETCERELSATNSKYAALLGRNQVLVNQLRQAGFEKSKEIARRNMSGRGHIHSIPVGAPKGKQ